MKEIFTKSENFKEEYCATVVKVGELRDIENSDNLKRVVIDGFSVVVNKNDVKEGDYMIYCKNETELSAQFLSVNNMYEIGERDKNANYHEVQRLIDEGNQDEAKKLVGYFNKRGRVKMIRLRGCPSMGVLMRLESLINWDPELKGVDLADYVKFDENGNFIPFDFDTVNGKLFIKAYVPKTNPCGGGGGKKKDAAKKFDRMIEGEWAFHYDTQQLNSNMWRFNPDTVVEISLKMHGTSIVLGNILVKKPTLANKMRDLVNRLKDRRIKRYDRSIEYYNRMLGGDTATNMSEDLMLKTVSELERRKARVENSKLRNFATEHCNVYSSRTVIKNRYINRQVNSGFYESDIWGEYNELLKGKIPEDVTVYGEIVGYLTGSDRMIQKGYDYGCEPGTNKLMIYRVNEKLGDGTHREYEIGEVIEFANRLVADFPDVSDRIFRYPLLYRGTLGILYPNVPLQPHWNENVLEALKGDQGHFGMELDEPLCKNKVPREGICLRIANDPVKECFKLKCLKFLQKEAKSIDSGEVDIETADNYS